MQTIVKVAYLCDKKRRIGDGKCNGSGCCDVAIDSFDYCEHTRDPNYALLKKSDDERVWSIDIYEESGIQFIYKTEVDPRDLD